MAKRGRPKQTTKDLKFVNQMLRRQVVSLTEQLDDYCKMADEKIKELTEERDNARRSSEDRFLMGQTLAKQLVEAEDRIKELLAEIRMYEREHDTLRQIIIEAMRGYDS